MEPETVIRPRANVLLYPSLTSSGSKRPPRARIVTPDPPVRAVKKPHKSTTITGVPPGIHPNNERNTLTNLVEALLSASRYPANVNRGIVGRVGATTMR